ncbi:ribosome recycling factor family protein [Vibrio sp. DW001]|uniref:ribosome recycling factor family protein n=1 Tax=Vibrio sp. DW001 TaxID=2912315 RepID=UPI0023AEC3F4|nr:ribosome recycling factor family protein [Vibrio sp. DW001]WED25272.1 ribosome recycling factor family protein [Vibrio sp. DW001]
MTLRPVKENDNILTPLPSLIHRIGGVSVKVAKQLVIEQGGVLKRIRRSRNWQLIADLTQLEKILEELKAKHPDKMRYIIEKLEKKRLECGPPPESKQDKLHRLITENPNATLAELMVATDCTVSEARGARFNIDPF